MTQVLNFNDPVYQDDGTLKELKDMGGGELPIASADILGGVKVGEGLTITEDGKLSALGGGGFTYDELYTNPDTSQAQGSINLCNISGYKYVIINTRLNTDSIKYINSIYVVVPTSVEAYSQIVSLDSDNKIIVRGIIKSSNSDMLSIANAEKIATYGSASGTRDNTRLIVNKVYGIK